jgi:hypothetical protein
VHAEGERILLRREGEDETQEINLTAGIPVPPEAELVEAAEGERTEPDADASDDEAGADEDEETPSLDATTSADEATDAEDDGDEPAWHVALAIYVRR